MLSIVKRAVSIVSRNFYSHRGVGRVPLILHFTYHKCLTVYYNRVLGHLAAEFGFQKQHFLPFDEFITHANAASPSKNCLFSIHPYVRLANPNDRGVWPDAISFDTSLNYVASHFIRNPKDLIVSGYKFHLWCNEDWFTSAEFDWSRYIEDPFFIEHLRPHYELPRNISYQDYLKKLNKEHGMILEMIFRQTTFPIMANWNYSDSNVLTLRYEDVINNEEVAFKNLFDHYQFYGPVAKRGLELAEHYSLRNQAKKEGSHVRHGGSNQWVNEFSEAHNAVFDEMYPDLMAKLNYS
jgi:hypothetical protein